MARPHKHLFNKLIEDLGEHSMVVSCDCGERMIISKKPQEPWHIERGRDDGD